MNRQVVVYLAGAIVSRLGAIILIPLYTRALTPDEYGQYALVGSVLQLLPLCATLGLTGGLTRVYFATERGQADAAMGAVARGMLLLATLSLGLLAAGVGFLGPPVLFGIARFHLVIAILASIGAVAAMVPDVYLRASQRAGAAAVLQVVSFLPTLVVGLVAVAKLRLGLTGAVAAACASAVFMGTFGLFFTGVRLPAVGVIPETRKALAYSIAFVPHFVATWLQLTADRWVLTAFGAGATLGTYYLALQLLSPIAMITSAYNDAEAARYGELYRSGGATAAYAELPRLVRNYFLVTLVPCFLLLVGAPILPYVIGARFLPALWLMPALGLSFLIDSLYYPTSNYVFYVGRTMLIPIVTTIAGVASVLLSILLLPRFGVWGVIVSRLAASVVRAGAMTLAARSGRPRS